MSLARQPEGENSLAARMREAPRRLDREVALNLLRPGAQGISAQQWLHEPCARCWPVSWPAS
jgi:hypothetical protein